MIKRTGQAHLRSLARELGLTVGKDVLETLTEHARTVVDGIVKQFPVTTLDELLVVLADRLSVTIEYVRSDDDIDRLASRYSSSALSLLLTAHFRRGATEGLLVRNPASWPGARRFLAIIDGRGARWMRAYFTAWHERVHLLLCPKHQLSFEFHRTPAAEEIQKDPIEVAVDHVAGNLGFYEPLFGPAVQKAIGNDGELTFDAIEHVRDELAPTASLQAAALAAMRCTLKPTVFLTAAFAEKKGTGRASAARRAKLVVPNTPAGVSGIKIHKNIRIPARSILHRLHRGEIRCESSSIEDQSWWETSTDGPLPSLLLRVRGVRRGSAVYGLISTNVPA